MKENKGKFLKVICYSGGIVALCGILYIANGLVGNPISRVLVSLVANEYIREHYQQLELERGKVGFNFKTGKYSVPLYSKKSQDTHFELYYNHLGKLSHTSYEWIIQNTWRRFREELKVYGYALADEKLGEDYHLVLMIDDEKHPWGEGDVVVLDQEVDLKNYPFDVEVIAEYLGTETPSYELAYRVLEEVHKVMVEETFHISKYGVLAMEQLEGVTEERGQSYEQGLAIYEIPPTLFEEENPIKVLEDCDKRGRIE